MQKLWRDNSVVRLCVMTEHTRFSTRLQTYTADVECISDPWLGTCHRNNDQYVNAKDMFRGKWSQKGCVFQLNW